MAVKKIYGTQNVVDAARTRIKNVFSNGVPVYLSFSSGKDSLCLSHLTYELILAGEIDARQLTVIFIDEEGLYKSMLEAAYRWRKIFLGVGARFEWYCLEVKQVSLLDHLSKTESWITWEKSKRDVWMREPPPFAITSHPLVPYAGYCNYQTFCDKRCRDGIQVIGTRASESLQRLQAISHTRQEINRVYPIYDWHDTDIWLYIKEHNLEFPEIYIRLYEAGVSRNKLRLCCFFGDSSIAGLKWVAETDPELWEKIERRYENAYLVLLYWDSEMFRRQTHKRRQLESDSDGTDYKAKLHDILFHSTGSYNIPADTSLQGWERAVKEYSGWWTPKLYKRACEAILCGDPKQRTQRSVIAALDENRWRGNISEESTDYRAKLYDILFLNTAKYNIPADTDLSRWRGMATQHEDCWTPKLYRQACEAILCGDPKNRIQRSTFMALCAGQAENIKKEIRDRGK